MIKLGIIGISNGNGHPYSWSAICNGYNEAAMKRSGYPSIVKYLSKQNFPQSSISNAKVTHVWCDSKTDAVKIAKATFIPNIADTIKELCERVDMILLARDDAENHYAMTKIVSKFNKPIFIDKPLAYSRKEALRILALEQYPGQIFSCSSLRYAKEFEIPKQIIKNTTLITAKVPKEWHKYSIHVLEPILSQFQIFDFKVLKRLKINDQVLMTFQSKKSKIVLEVISTGAIASTIEFCCHTKYDANSFIFKDSFSCFKKSIEIFLSSSKKKHLVIPREETLAIISLIEEGAKL